MPSSARPRLPFKGTIVASVSACLGLWALSVQAEKLTEAHGAKLAALKGGMEVHDPGAAFDSIDLGSAETLEDQLAPFLPLPGVNSDAWQRLPGEASQDEPRRSLLPSVEAVRAARPPGWVYPAFDMPAEGLHGPPATELPRNIRFQVVDARGLPVVHDSIEVHEQTVDGLIELAAYRAADDGAEWTFGIPRLMTGATAYFLIEAEVDGKPLGATLRLEDLSVDVDIDGGQVQLREKIESAWGLRETGEVTLDVAPGGRARPRSKAVPSVPAPGPAPRGWRAESAPRSARTQE